MALIFFISILRVITHLQFCFLTFFSESSLCPDMLQSIRQFEFLKYLSNSWNIIDWSHFCVMWLGWYIWLRQILLTNSLPMEPNYPILISPGSTTQARAFLTDGVHEHKFLMFSANVKQLAVNMSTYSTLTCLGGASQFFI